MAGVGYTIDWIASVPRSRGGYDGPGSPGIAHFFLVGFPRVSNTQLFCESRNFIVRHGLGMMAANQCTWKSSDEVRTMVSGCWWVDFGQMAEKG